MLVLCLIFLKESAGKQNACLEMLKI